MLKFFTYVQAQTAGRLSELKQREEGQTMAEYAVVLSVIAAIVFAALVLLRDEIASAIETVAGIINDGSTGGGTTPPPSPPPAGG